MKIDLDLNELRGQLLSAFGLSPRTSNHAIVIKVKCLLIDGLEQCRNLELQKREAVEAEREVIRAIIASKEPPPGFAEWVADTKREAVREALAACRDAGLRDDGKDSVIAEAYVRDEVLRRLACLEKEPWLGDCRPEGARLRARRSGQLP